MAATVKSLLDEAPLGSKDAALKSAHASKVFGALEKVNEKQAQEIVDSLEPDQGDILLKYVYRGLETPGDKNLALFKLQQKLVDKFGVGSIVRVLADRKTV